MSYKTILVQVDESKHASVRIRAAADIAKSEDAHLVGIGMTGLAKFLEQAVAADPYDPVMAPVVETLRLRAKSALDKFNEIVESVGVHSVETRLIDDAAAQGFCRQAVYADLVVVGQNDPKEKLLPVGSDFPEYVAMNCQCPALILPYMGAPSAIGTKILIAWNGSAAAKRSVVNALPMLKRASAVDIAVFVPAHPETDPKEGRQHGADIALFLVRHGVRANIKEQVSSHNGIGNDLLALAASIRSDLIVMGCYGRSRFSEMMFGGVSRLVLQSMTVPVLMSH